MVTARRGQLVGTRASPGLSGVAVAMLLAASLAARVATGATPLSKSPIGPLPATFAGVLPCANCRGIRYQIDLLPNSRFNETVERLHGGHTRATELAHGIWWISPDGRKLTLDAGSDADGQAMRSTWWVTNAGTLRLFDQQSDSVTTESDQELARTDSLPRLSWRRSLPEFSASLARTRWVPIRIGRRSVALSSNQHEPWIVLEPKNRHVTGSGGSSEITGSFDFGVTTLRIRAFVVARTACLDSGRESAFLRALNQTWGYRLAGRRLVLLDIHGAALAELEERNI